ncbi:MAG: cell division protein ZapB [Spirochaetia bacterium]|jgi:TolA-binding protein
MISLEQIRQLESKISRAIELIRVLKDENGTLRKGLESAQKRMKELESLVDGFKTDQREIESVIVRTLHNLDELEESTMAGKKAEHAEAGASSAFAPAAPSTGPTLSASPAAAPASPASPATAPAASPTAQPASGIKAESSEARPSRRPAVVGAQEPPETRGLPKAHETPAAKEELDIF